MCDMFILIGLRVDGHPDHAMQHITVDEFILAMQTHPHGPWMVNGAVVCEVQCLKKPVKDFERFDCSGDTS